MTTRVAVFGAGGRMGQEVCRAVEGAPDLKLVAAIDPHHEGTPLDALAGTATGLELAADLDELAATEAQVAVDFTVVEAARENLDYCAANGVHAVVGTTGFTDEDIERYRSEFADSNCLIAPNFAIGAVLMMRFAELAAPYFENAEVIELHHDAKIDAPSGTAMMTLERMAAVSDDWGSDPTEHEVLPGSRGGKGPADIPVHSLRLRGLVAHQEVLLGTTGQTLSIRHDSIDRTSFMPGVLLGVRGIADHPGVTLGLDALLGL
ncbi:MAG: 4-hydroxy-tetrahydrodipicolinate reductase [Acidimicrobiales bacterium]